MGSFTKNEEDTKLQVSTGWHIMRLTKHTDLGLQILMYLALRPQDLHTIGDLSVKFDVSRHHLMKVANRVVNLGYADSTRGQFGGLQLAGPAKKIRTGKVIEDLEQTLGVVDCPFEPACILNTALAGGVNSFIAKMNKYTLADLIENDKKLLKLVG